MNCLVVARRIASYLTGAACLWIAGRSIYYAITGLQTITSTVFVVVIFGLFAAGLFAMNTIARRIAAALSLFVAFLIPVGYINPYMEMDMQAAGHEPPPASIFLLWMIPTVMGLLALAWLLDPPRVKTGGAGKRIRLRSWFG